MEIKVDRTSLRLYGDALKAFTNEELTREVWMLDEHIRYLVSLKTKEDNQTADHYQRLLIMAREEKELRMFSQGYQ